MGAHSTLVVTQEDARKLIEAKGGLTDEVLEALLDRLYYDELWNFRVVDEYQEDDRTYWNRYD